MKRLIICLMMFVFTVALNAQVPVPTTTITIDEAKAELDTNQLRVHFIDIGPGLAVLVQTPDDRFNIFIDGGKWGLDDMMKYVLKFVPDDETIDLAIVTHADSDHYQGMRKIFGKYENVSEFWYTGYTSDILEASSLWTGFLNEVEDKEDCIIRNPISDWKTVGDTITVDDQETTETEDDVEIVLLNIDADPPEKDFVSGRTFKEDKRRNNASLVFKLVFGNVSFLFTGDINGRDEDSADTNEIDSEELELWVRHTLHPEKFSLEADVLQVSHHGSNGATSTKFLEAVNAEWAVISAGHAYDHPRTEALARLQSVGAKVLRTDEGDSTPETDSIKDPRGDDCYIFQADEEKITKLLKVKVN